MANYNNIISELKSEFPGFKISKKSDSKLMIVINFMLKIITFWRMKEFMKNFITTIGTTVYVPMEWETWTPIEKIIVLRHERVHMRQGMKYGNFLFKLMYLLLLPTVITFRSKFEMEAYEETIRGNLEYYGERAFSLEYREKMISHFTSSQYFWMDPCRQNVVSWYDKVVNNSLSEEKRHGPDR